MMERELCLKEEEKIGKDLLQIDAPQVENEGLTGFCFKVGNIGLLLSSDISSEVISNTPIYPVPDTVSWFYGLINLRGNLIPVFNLHQALKISKEHLAVDYLLVLDVGEKAIAITLCGHPELVSGLVLSDRPFAAPEFLSRHIQQIYESAGSIWLRFDKDSLFRALGNEVVLKK